MMRRLLLFLCMHICTFSSAQRSKDAYGSNIIMASVLMNNGGPGVGLQYEMLFGDRKQYSFVTPIAVCLGYAPARGGRSGGKDLRPITVFTEPGIRFYPTSSTGVVRYSIGCHLMYGTGDGAYNSYTNGTNNLGPRTVIGLLINHNIHFQITPFIRSDIEFGFGVGSDDGINSDKSIPLVGQASFSLGYRW